MEIEKAPRSPKFRKLEKQYSELLKKLAVFVFPFSPLDGKSILDNADALADTTIGYAEVNKEFCSVLENILNASPLVAMISMYASLISAILSNHGLNPVENMLKTRLEKMNGKDTLQPVSTAV